MATSDVCRISTVSAVAAQCHGDRRRLRAVQGRAKVGCFNGKIAILGTDQSESNAENDDGNLRTKYGNIS